MSRTLKEKIERNQLIKIPEGIEGLSWKGGYLLMHEQVNGMKRGARLSGTERQVCFPHYEEHSQCIVYGEPVFS